MRKQTIEWKPSHAYVVMIGRNGQDGKEIERKRFRKALWTAKNTFLQQLDALTRATIIQMMGETKRWGKERSYFIFTISGDEDRATSVINEAASELRVELDQQQVWVTKIDLSLLIVQEQT